MLKQVARFQAWWNSDEGASLVEYAFLLLLIAVVTIVIITQVGENTSGAFSKAGSGFD
jgi:Flp pilus assembly pilin Flp